MPTAMPEFNIDDLTVAQRLDLIGQIWDSVASEIEDVPLSGEQQREVERRLAAHDANPGAAIAWEQVEAEALARLARK